MTYSVISLVLANKILKIRRPPLSIRINKEKHLQKNRGEGGSPALLNKNHGLKLISAGDGCVTQKPLLTIRYTSKNLIKNICLLFLTTIMREILLVELKYSSCFSPLKDTTGILCLRKNLITPKKYKLFLYSPKYKTGNTLIQLLRINKSKVSLKRKISKSQL